jgi:peptidoglycan/LPS O-acetylase OafA/YrhL
MPSYPPVPSTGRIPLVDAFKAVASQLIVLHHLSFYGPMSDAAEALAPGLIGWLGQHGRLAVQVFLVVGGLLAARSLAPGAVPNVADPWQLIVRRYSRLIVPYLFALGIAMLGAAIAGAWMTHDSIPAPPTPQQLLIHVLLLQDILGRDALTAGAWYVAIDFQLFFVSVLILWLLHRLGGRRSPALVASTFVIAVAVSWLTVNPDPTWDPWAAYFFGAYGFGALACWASASKQPARWLLALLVFGLLLGAWNTRPHLPVALATAMSLGLASMIGKHRRSNPGGAIAWLGRISYSVFLVHFPVCLVVNALVNRVAPGDPWSGALGMLLAWAASVAAGALFHTFIETPMTRGLSLPALRPAASIPDRRARPASNRA